MNKQEFMAASHRTDLMIKIDGYGGFWKYTEARISNGVFFYGGKQKGCNYIKNGQIETVFPVLHPLSDLTKPIEHKGEVLIPAKYWDRSLLDNFRKRVHAELVNMSKHVYFDGYLPYFVTEKLIEWHFDIAGLIEKGEAVDVNTLEANPYRWPYPHEQKKSQT